MIDVAKLFATVEEFAARPHDLGQARARGKNLTMDLRTFLATVIIVLFLVTIVMAIGSYGAYKLRERRRPEADRMDAGDESVFFERIDAAALDADGTNSPTRG